ncbi:MAG: helix-turn-helix transcriptional regulator [Bacteroidales bacterium]|nr:helix-turn-helix transcriptional regulator [Bacteroidales bacterium]MBQ8809539.1 helix-turn-helix transcriptional regulator [Bacteroidales bacterium]
MNEFKSARLAAGITQQEMADLMKIPKRTIGNWENDVSHPPEYVKRFVLNELESIAKNRNE